MALSTLSIDLNAKLASFEQNLAKSVAIAQANASKLEKSFAGVSNVIRGLGASLGVAALLSIGKQAISSAAALDDMSERTGASVESLSRLSQVAAISGIDLGTFETGLIRLTKALSGADDESKGSAEGFAALGLKASQLRTLDSAEALETVAKAFANRLEKEQLADRSALAVRTSSAKLGRRYLFRVRLAWLSRIKR